MISSDEIFSKDREDVEDVLTQNNVSIKNNILDYVRVTKIFNSNKMLNIADSRLVTFN